MYDIGLALMFPGLLNQVLGHIPYLYSAEQPGLPISTTYLELQDETCGCQLCSSDTREASTAGYIWLRDGALLGAGLRQWNKLPEKLKTTPTSVPPAPCSVRAYMSYIL